MPHSRRCCPTLADAALRPPARGLPWSLRLLEALPVPPALAGVVLAVPVMGWITARFAHALVQDAQTVSRLARDLRSLESVPGYF